MLLQTACSIDREERQKFYSVRLLRSRNAGALPCEATPAGVEAFLQCEVGSVQHVERMRDNALGKQRYIVRFSTAEAATAAYAGFRDSSNAAQALLVQKKTRLQNALVDLAIQLQQLGRGQCGYGEELVVQVRGKAIVVKLGEGELVPYPFRQHLPSGRIPSPGEPFLHLNAGRLGQQLKQLLKPPSPSPAAAAAAAARPAAQAPTSPAPPPAQTAAAGTTAAGATAAAASGAPVTPTKRKRTSQEPNPVQHQHYPPPAAGAAAPVQEMHAGGFGGAKRHGQTADQETRVRAHKTAQAIQAAWVPNRRYGGVYGGPQGPSIPRAMSWRDYRGYLSAEEIQARQRS